MNRPEKFGTVLPLQGSVFANLIGLGRESASFGHSDFQDRKITTAFAPL